MVSTRYGSMISLDRLTESPFHYTVDPPAGAAAVTTAPLLAGWIAHRICSAALRNRVEPVGRRVGRDRDHGFGWHGPS